MAVTEHAPAEADHPALPVADRDHEPAAEGVVVAIARFVKFDQPGFQDLVDCEAQLLQVCEQGIPTV